MRRKIFSWKKMQLLLLFCCMLSLSDLGVFAQSSIAIKGQVVDAGNNEPLIGVSIQEKGTANGVITDIDGNFTLNAPAGSTIVFSYIGYKTVEMKATAVKGIIKLTEDSQSLQEVVVVGYGVQKKVNLSGSVSAIEGDKIAAKPSSNAMAALQGELPGVTITRNSGQPGSETSGMQIRGASSVNKTSTLILIDGITHRRPVELARAVIEDGAGIVAIDHIAYIADKSGFAVRLVDFIQLGAALRRIVGHAIHNAVGAESYSRNIQRGIDLGYVGKLACFQIYRAQVISV